MTGDDLHLRVSHIQLRCERCGESRPYLDEEGADAADVEAYGASITRVMLWVEKHLGCGSDDPDPDPVPAPFRSAFDGDEP